ncbi:MAG TPA: WD40 repeat domain-containing protein, partial [Cytophagales bacterium]
MLLLPLLILVFRAVAQPLELSIQTGHSLGITHLCFNQNARLLASCGDDNLIVLWDVQSGKQIRSLRSHTAPVRQVVFHPVQGWLASASEDGSVVVWDVQSGAVVRVFQPGMGPLSGIDFSRDGSRMAVSGKKVVLYDTRQWQPVPVAALPELPRGRYECVKVDASGQHLAASSRRAGKIWLADLARNRVTRTLRLRSNAIGYGENDQYLVAAGASGKLRRWRLHAGSQLFTRFSIPANKWTDSFLSVALSARGDYFAGGNRNHQVWVYDLTKGKTHRVIKEHAGKVQALTFNPEGTVLASAGSDRVIHFWDVQAGDLIKSFTGQSGAIHTLDADSLGKFLVCGDSEGYCKRIDLEAGGDTKAVQMLPPAWHRFWGWRSAVTQTRLVPGGRQVLANVTFFRERPGARAARKARQRLARWDFNTGQVTYFRGRQGNLAASGRAFSTLSKRRLTTYRYQEDTRAFAHTRQRLPQDRVGYHRAGWQAPEGDWWVGPAASGGYAMHNFKTGRSTPLPDSGRIEEVAFAGDRLAWRTDRGQVHLFDLAHGQPLAAFRGSGPLLATGNELLFATPGDSVCVVDLARAVVTRTFPTGHTSSITSLRQVPARSVLLSGSLDGSIRFWSWPGGEPKLSLVPVGTRNKVLITPDQYYLATKGALKGVGFTRGDKVYTFEQFDHLYNRPDRVMAQLEKPASPLVDLYEQAYQKRMERLHLAAGTDAEAGDPPSLALRREALPLTTGSPVLHLQADATGGGHPLQRLLVWVNGVPAYGMKGAPLPRRAACPWEGDITLSRGKNRVEIAAENSGNVRSPTAVFEVYYKSPPRKPDLYVVSIGVARYQEDSRSLAYADRDASQVSALLNNTRKRYRRVHTKVLLNEAVTRENFLTLNAFLAGAGVDDVVVIFMAGHGLLDAGKNYYFATYDLRFDQPGDRGIPYAALEALLDGLKSRKKLLLLDTCHSGEYDATGAATPNAPPLNAPPPNAPPPPDAAGNKRSGYGVAPAGWDGLQESFELSKFLFADLKDNCGASIISAATGPGFALEGAQWRNGVFTYCLLNGLQTRKADLNADRKVTVMELQEYVSTQVDAQTNGQQRPTF